MTTQTDDESSLTSRSLARKLLECYAIQEYDTWEDITVMSETGRRHQLGLEKELPGTACNVYVEGEGFIYAITVQRVGRSDE